MSISFFKVNRFFKIKENLIRLEILFALLFGQLFAFLFDTIVEVTFSYLAINLYCFFLFIIFLASFYFIRIKKNLRKISNGVYIYSFLFVLFIAYQNNFNTASFFAIILIYSFFNFMFSSVRIYFVLNSIAITSLLFFLFLLNFSTETPLGFIFSAIGLLSLAGYSITSARAYYRRKIKEKEKMLRFIFNETPRGLLLIKQKNNCVFEINEKAIKILGYQTKEELIGKNVFEIKLDGKAIVESSDIDQKRNIELKDERIIIIETKKANYKTDKYFLVYIKEYENKKKLNSSTEVNVFKIYSEENYESLFEYSSNMMCIIDKQGKIIDVNKGVSKLTEYKKEEIIGLKHNKLDAFNYDIEREKINKKAWKGEIQEFEKSIFSKKGKTIEIEVILQKGKYFGKEVLISNFKDITERKRLEEKVLHNVKRYNTLFNQSPIGIVVSDLEGNILDVNHGFERLIGYKKEEILKLNVADISDEKGMKTNLKLREKLLRGDINEVEMGKVYITKKGERVFCLLKIIVQNNKGKPQTLLGQVVDITEIEKTERKLKESEKSYRDIFNNTYELLYILDRDNKFIDVNKTVIDKYGYKKEEIIGKGPDLFSADGKNDLVEVERKIRKVWKGEEQSFFWWSKTKEGSIFPKTLQLRKGVYFGKEVIIASGRDISEQRSYEGKIEKSRKKYKELIDSSIVGVIIFKGEEIVFANKKVAEILKEKNESVLIGRKRIEFIQEQDKEVYKERIKRLYAGEEVEMKEFTILDVNNKKVEVEIKPKLIEFEGETCVMLSALDVSDKVKAKEAKKKIEKAKTTNINLKYQLEQNRLIQKELLNSKAYTEGIIESSLDMIFTTNKNGKIIRLNPAAEKELQLTNREEYFEKTFELFFQNKKLAKTILEKLSRNIPYSGEVNLLRKDGSTFPSFLSINNLISTGNQFVGIMGISRDISDIKAKENEIKKQASKLNAIIESSSHFFFTVDKQRKITSFNELFKNDVEEKYKHTIEVGDLFYSIFAIKQREIDREEMKLFWEKKFQSVFKGEKERFENKRYDSEGKVFYREIYLNPIYNKSREIKEVSCIGHDTTKQRIAEKELQNSLEEKNVLLQEVHHRVKNNMQVISSILSLQSTYVKDEETVNILRESQSRIRAMAAIHERLYRTKNFSDIKFSSYVKNLAENIIETYELSNKTVELSCKLDEVFLTLDLAIPCGLIINELISNSLKYAFKNKERGKISVILINEKRKITLKLADDGIGFPKEVDYKKTESLGLQLVSTLVEQIEGTIKLENQKGTSFIIEFSPN